MPVSPLVPAVAAYTARVLPELLDLGPATSALAPWMLAALVSPGASGAARTDLERELGLRADDAAREVSTLLERGPVALRSAIALWRSPALATDGELGAWERRVAPAAATGPVPTQPEADAWTDQATLGMIRRFPVPITPDIACLLAAAITTRIRWDEPLRTDAAPSNDWNLARMLYAGPNGVYATDAGLVGVASGGSWADRLAVYSFISEPGVSRADLAGVAMRLVGAWHAGGRMPDWAWQMPPAKLPVEGHAWTTEAGHGDGSAMVPAFAEACDGVDVSTLPAVREAAVEYGRLVTDALPKDLRPASVEARLSAVARYDRLGFEAAAVAAIAARPAAVPAERRVLHLRFTRPHLVIAVATDETYSGLPLFAAWVDAGVREPDEAGDDV